MSKLIVDVYYDHGKRSRVLCENMYKGINSLGDVATLRYADNYDGKPLGDIAVFYGLRGNLLRILNDYKDAGKVAILIDLGFWGRQEGGRLSGYHKFVVNDLQPGSYFMEHKHPSDRFDRFGIDVKSHNPDGEYILLAGMSGKAAGVYGLKPEEYERSVIKKLREITDLPIVYRAKPTFKDATKLEGTIYSAPEEDINDVIQKARIVVSHHSNVAVDSIIAGKPVITDVQCVASVFSNPLETFSLVNEPYFPPEEERMQWLYDIAYTQWNVREMRKGVVWNHFKTENLI
jgi:hypothetical protein